MNFDGLVIERPDVLSPRRRYSYSVVTFIFWLVWLYLWLPFISLVMWGLGFEFFYEHMIALGGYRGFLEQITLYVGAILLVTVLYMGWARYNYQRYGRGNRRGRGTKLDNMSLAKYFGVSWNELINVQREKSVLVIHDITENHRHAKTDFILFGCEIAVLRHKRRVRRRSSRRAIEDIGISARNAYPN